MSYETIQVAPVTPRIGAEISGIDLGRPLGNQQFKELHDALVEHQVLFFRDQTLDLDRQKALGRQFGELHIHPASNSPEGHPEILPIHADENRSMSQASAGTRTCRATPSRPWAASSHAQLPAVGRRHPLRQHVRRLRGALDADEGLCSRA